jgi:ubiquinone/menaquinone biosynthesis C-methylase UbiE
VVSSSAQTGRDKVITSLNFDPLVKYYDETRTVDAASLTASIQWLARRFPPDQFPALLEPGIGTGRIAVPLAGHGYTVHGVDVSEAMLAALADHLAKRDTPLRVSYLLADVQQLPFASESFDIVVAVHLFYFIRGWKQAVAELLRVLRAGGPVILMHTGMGMEIPFVNDRYKELCAEQGCHIAPLGVSSTQQVVEYLAELGCPVEFVRNRWQWTSHIPVGKAISYVRSRAYSFATGVPNAVHSRAIRSLEAEATDRFGSLSAEVRVENQVYLVIARKH